MLILSHGAEKLLSKICSKRARCVEFQVAATALRVFREKKLFFDVEKLFGDFSYEIVQLKPPQKNRNAKSHCSSPEVWMMKSDLKTPRRGAERARLENLGKFPSFSKNSKIAFSKKLNRTLLEKY